MGDCEALGHWNVDGAPTLLQCRDGAFRRLRNLPRGATATYKCVKVTPAGTLIWEDGENRILRTGDSVHGQLVVNVTFGGGADVESVDVDAFKVRWRGRRVHAALASCEARGG